ncbi:MAG: hydroxyisourate hydrolase [Gammaproteobacteria bacterium]|nr:hydroxyisourate hydrolase [Gammaproteobacteria bacterium]MYD76436.1 hydroxyisourate hydrolase [Gammaproteobacteria bacterium]MYJ52580.1 hydroxyisourate hydrolase [Gammaproteobacteria bacterium]
MDRITTHILDTSKGRPVADIRVQLHVLRDTDWKQIGSNLTDSDGRTGFAPIDSGNDLEAGVYRIRFNTADYFTRQDVDTFYPYVDIAFRLPDNGEHYHVPLLISPFGYTTYRGS